MIKQRISYHIYHISYPVHTSHSRSLSVACPHFSISLIVLRSRKVVTKGHRRWLLNLLSEFSLTITKHPGKNLQVCVSHSPLHQPSLPDPSLSPASAAWKDNYNHLIVTKQWKHIPPWQLCSRKRCLHTLHYTCHLHQVYSGNEKIPRLLNPEQPYHQLNKHVFIIHHHIIYKADDIHHTQRSATYQAKESNQKLELLDLLY